MKALNEKRGQLMKQLRDMTDTLRTENRAFTAEELDKFGEIEDEIRRLDESIESEKRAQELMCKEQTPADPDTEKKDEKRAAKRSGNDIVNDFVRGIEVRSEDGTLDGVSVTSSGSIVPMEYSEDIIREVKELSGILNLITTVNSTGTYNQLLADDEEQVKAHWTAELAEIEESKVKYRTVPIGHEKLASIVPVSIEAINQTAFDIVGDIKTQQIDAFAEGAEEAILSGSGSGQPFGLSTSGEKFDLASNSAITADELIKIYHKLKTKYSRNAVWIMSNATLLAVRLLKDNDGQYLFHSSDLTSGYAGTILGKNVLVSDVMDDLGEGKTPIYFGDFRRAYKANLNPGISIQMLMELYAKYGARGVLAIMFLGGRPVNKSAYVKAVCPGLGG